MELRKLHIKHLQRILKQVVQRPPIEKYCAVQMKDTGIIASLYEFRPRFS